MNAAESPTQMDTKASLQVWMFESALRAFAGGSVTYTDVQARVRRLLATGTSPTELLKIVHRSQSTEPLPESAQGIIDLLDEAVRRQDAAEDLEATEVQGSDPQATAPQDEVVEQSVARQQAANEAPTRSYEQPREPDPAALSRATALTTAHTTTLAAELAAARIALTAEQRRTRDLSLALAEKDAVVEGSRSRVTEILRDYERQKKETETLRDSLEARDAIIDQIQQSLGDRDGQIAALRQEHAGVAPTIEAHVEARARLEADLRAALARSDALLSELKDRQEAAAVLDAQIKRSESRLKAALTELDTEKAQSTCYLELIRTREWRRGFEHNMIRELDAEVGAAHAGSQALESERDRLRNQLTAAESESARLTSQLAARDRALLQAKERAASDAQSVARSKKAADLRQAELAAQIAELRAEHAAHLEGLQAEQETQVARLQTEQAAQIEELQAEARERATRAAQSFAESKQAADLRHAELAAQIVQLRGEHAAQIEVMQAEAQERAISAAQSVAESKQAADLRHAEQAAQIVQLRGEHAAHLEGLQAEQEAQVARLQTEQAAQMQRLQVEQAAQVLRLQVEVEEARGPVQALESERGRLQSQLATAQSEWGRLTAELAVRDRALVLAEEGATGAAQSLAESKEAVDLRQAEQAAQIMQLRAEHAAHVEELRAEYAAEVERFQAERAAQIERIQAEVVQRQERIGALTAHLEELHQPVQAFESERERLLSQLAEADSERARLAAELALRDRALLLAEERATGAAQSIADSTQAADLQKAELAAQVAELRAEHAAQIEEMQAERAAQIQRLQTEQTAQIERLQAEAEEARRPIQTLESERERLQSQLAAADGERARLTTELAERDRALLLAEERATGAALSVAESKEAAELWQAELATQVAELRAEHAAHIEQLRAKQASHIEQLRAEADQREEETGELLALLEGARRPAQEFEADLKRLTAELAAKDGIAAVFDEQNRKLAAILEWTCEAVEECEAILRRQGPGEGNHANVLGRIQTSIIERLKSVSRGPAAAGIDPGAAVAGAPDRSAELVRIDGERPTTYVLAKRTRIGRATACELKIDSGSVSRHHALVIVGPRETIIEDLNSTNGVLVNGRKVTRRVLIDGDALTIGDTRFRYFVRPHDGPPVSNSADGTAPHNVIQ